MFTVKSPALRLCCVVICASWLASLANAHPVTQGAMEVRVTSTQIVIRASVSAEEVLVAFAGSPEGAPARTDWAREYGNYLLAHLRVSADGKVLRGEVLSAAGELIARPVYELQYPLTDGIPRTIVLEQDALREQEYALGNRWEASYLVQLTVSDRLLGSAQLLATQRPLRLECTQEPARPSYIIIGMFMRHGIVHILSGYDHLLFITALVLAASSIGDLVKVISAFTVAHSITLALAALDVLRLPPNVVEPVIAGSIVFVATQNIFWPRRARGAARLLVAFIFGLFHGLGFAGGLLDAMTGMHASGAILAIIGFSLGVEVGHLTVIMPTFVTLRLLGRRWASSWAGPDGAEIALGECRQSMLLRYGSATISLIGLMYFVAALRHVGAAGGH